MEQNIKMKLTPVQNKVLYCLQNGWRLLTENCYKGAIVHSPSTTVNEQFHIDNGVFWRMVDNGLISQELSYPFEYLITKQGMKTITKKP